MNVPRHIYIILYKHRKFLADSLVWGSLRSPNNNTYLKSRLNTNITELARFARSLTSYLSGRRSLASSLEKHLDSMVMIAPGGSRNVRIYPLTVLFTFTMVIIINCTLGLMIKVAAHARIIYCPRDQILIN